jgi:hypothetical protein
MLKIPRLYGFEIGKDINNIRKMNFQMNPKKIECLFSFFLIITFLVLLSGCSSSNPSSAYGNLINYQNSSMGIKILYPEGWQKIETKEEIIFLPEDIGDFEEGIFIQRLRSDMSLEDWVSPENPHLVEGNKYRLIESHETTVSGYKAIKYNYTQDNRFGKKMQGVGIFISKDPYVFSVTATTSPNNYSEQSDNLNKIINSFDFI